MKTPWLLAALGLAVSAAALASGDDKAEIQKRIEPVGSVYLAGAEPEVKEPTGPRSGEQMYNGVCIACHGGALPEAPKLHNVADWAPRKAKGIDTLLDHALNGFNNMTPQKAMGSEEEIRAAIEYMMGDA